jgi:TolB-like protein/Flp pilus assembly protein TadD
MQAAGSTRPSIAVLAFENMSADPENAFFAEGISEEILNVLAGVEGLKVASRTSAFSFSGRDTPIPEIAEQLGVDHVLEGSVRKAGNRVRITAQLIDAGDDAHLWSDVYDRELDDIFAVQEEIARSITGALTGILQTSMVSVDAPTENLEAYQAFLRGRSRFYQRLELDEAISDLRRAVELDPEFAQAWAMLAAAEYVVGGDGYRTNLDTAALKAQSSVSVDHALSLDARSPIAQAVKGRLLIQSGGSNTIEEGLMMLEGAASTLSPDSTPLLWLGIALMELGYPERARDVLERAQEQDPLVAINNGYLGLAYAMLGQQQRGQRYALRAVELSGSLTFWVDLVAIGLANDGEAEQAVDLLEETQAWLDAEGSELMSTMISALNEEWTFEQLAGRFSNSPDAGLIAYLQVTAALLLGDIETALLEASGSLDGPRYALALAAWLPSMIKLREHPAYFRWMSELGHVDYWRRHEFPFDCVEVHDQAGARLECGDSR